MITPIIFRRSFIEIPPFEIQSRHKQDYAEHDKDQPIPKCARPFGTQNHVKRSEGYKQRRDFS